MNTRLVCNDRNNAMENWRKDDLMNERSSFTDFFPRCLITAQIINSMPLSIDSRCHTSRRRPLPHKDAQSRGIFRLLQCCRSEVDRLRSVPASSLRSGSTSLFKQHVVSLQRACVQLCFGSTCSWQSWGGGGWRFWESLAWVKGALVETKISDCLLYTTLPPCGLKVWSVLAAWHQHQPHT